MDQWWPANRWCLTASRRRLLAKCLFSKTRLRVKAHIVFSLLVINCRGMCYRMLRNFAGCSARLPSLWQCAHLLGHA